MPAITLDAYSVTIRPKRKKEQLRLGAFNGHSSALDEIFALLHDVEGEHEDLPTHNKCLRVTDIQKTGASINARLWAGQYGTRNPLVDAPTGRVTHNKTTSEASMEPFFFSLYLPNEFRKGILMTQRFGQAGIKTVLSVLLIGKFKEKHNDYILELRPLMPQQALQALLSRSKIAEIRFIQNTIPSDFADKFNNENRAEEGEIEVVLRTKGRGYLNPRGLLDIIEGRRNAEEFIELEDFHPDNIKAEIDLSGRRRIIDFGNTGKFHASFDITEDVELGDDSYPELGSIIEINRVLVEDISEKMNINK